jgi:hypothetical protein
MRSRLPELDFSWFRVPEECRQDPSKSDLSVSRSSADRGSPDFHARHLANPFRTTTLVTVIDGL